jgi:hypothetical protein
MCGFDLLLKIFDGPRVWQVEVFSPLSEAVEDIDTR